MNEHIVFCLILSYLIGSIPFGYVIYYITDKEDIRKKGSGNIGATNIFRLKGIKIGIITLLLDMIKGIIPLVYALHNFNNSVIVLMVGAIAVFGHMYPIYLKFKGGKGVATFLGILSVFYYPSLFVFLILFFLVVYFQRYISAASITAVSGVFFLMLFTQTVWIAMVTFILVIFITLKHQENIKRLIKGEEKRIGQKKR